MTTITIEISKCFKCPFCKTQDSGWYCEQYPELGKKRDQYGPVPEPPNELPEDCPIRFRDYLIKADFMNDS
jgi:hypothetical protein